MHTPTHIPPRRRPHHRAQPPRRAQRAAPRVTAAAPRAEDAAGPDANTPSREGVEVEVGTLPRKVVVCKNRSPQPILLQLFTNIKT